MHRSLIRPMLAVATALSLTACSHEPSPGDDRNGNSSGKTDSLFPDGSDELGRITVVPLALPNVAPALAYHVARDPNGLPNDMLHFFSAPPNNVRLSEGKHWVSVDSGVQGLDAATFALKPKETLTLALGGLHVDGYQKYPVTLGITPTWGSSRGDVLRDPKSSIFDGSFATTPGFYVQVLPVPFSYSLWGDQFIDERPVDVLAGALTSVDLTIADPRVTFAVSTPDRSLPDAEPAANQQGALGSDYRLTFPTFASFAGSIPCETPSNEGNYWYSDCLSAFVNGGKRATKATAIGSNFTKQRYYFAINGVYVEVQGNAGQTVEAPRRRLDVHDIAVDIEDGSTQSYKGTWSLEWYWQAGHQYVELAWFKDRPTGTGVDLVPGKYRATVSYSRGQQPSPDVKVYEVEIK